MSEHVSIEPWETSEAPRACLLPGKMEPKMADVLTRLRSMHCSRKRASHDCSGRIVVDRNGMTLTCPLCGDERSVFGGAL